MTTASPASSSSNQEQQVVPFLCLSLSLFLCLSLNPNRLHSPLATPLSWPLRLGPSNQCPVAGLNPRIDDYIILYYKFLIEYISSITPLGKIYLLSLQRATVKGFIHRHTPRTQSKQSQSELPCQAVLDELKLNNELSRQGNLFQFQQLIVE